MSWLLEIELILLPTNKIKLLDSSKHTYKTKLHLPLFKKNISLRFFWQFFLYVMVALICFPEHCELSFSLLSSLLLQSWCAWEQWPFIYLFIYFYQKPVNSFHFKFLKLVYIWNNLRIYHRWSFLHPCDKIIDTLSVFC